MSTAVTRLGLETQLIRRREDSSPLPFQAEGVSTPGPEATNISPQDVGFFMPEFLQSMVAAMLQANRPQVEPIGCNREEAIRFLGCSESMFEELHARKIIRSLRKGWYTYDDLRKAVKDLEGERKSEMNHEINQKTKGTRSKRASGALRSEGSRSYKGNSEEFLRKHNGRSLRAGV